MDDMQRNLDEMKKVMDKWGMKMHCGKTKVMIVSRTEEKCKLSIDKVKILKMSRS